MKSRATPRQREAIELHDLSMVVTAGAGTGKTFVLVEKYLNLIENQGFRPREILALTFTDKAATEMKERVRETIGKRIAWNPDNPFWKEVAEEVIIAPIMTFHSFCAQVLREFAIEAGLEAGFLIIDEGQAVAIRKDAFDTLLKKPSSEATHEALVNVLAQVEKFRLHEILSAISQCPDRYEQFFSQVRLSPAGLIPAWQEYLESVRSTAVDRFFADARNTSLISQLLSLNGICTDARDSAASYLDQVHQYLLDLTPESSYEQLSLAAKGFLSVRPRGKIGSQKNWDPNDLDLLRTTKKELTAHLERAAPYFHLFLDEGSSFTRATLAFYRDIAVLTEEYLAHVTALKKQASGIDFGDLIARAKQFLHENQDLVATHLRPRIRYILVDEFQDTDPAQFDIVRAIIGDLCPDTKSLFIVGDPKQSIYLFRDADVTRFKEAQNTILSDCKGRVINLDTSFRSSREVIGVVNHLFREIFASTEKAWEFGYEPILTCDERKKSKGSVLVMLPQKAPTGGTAADSKDIEAGMIADLVHRIVETGSLQVTGRDGIARPAGYGDIAILIERRTHLTRYMDALSRRDTPYYVHGGIGFYSRQELYDIYNLLSFLLRPYDDAALYGVLRSPYFSLSDTTLYRIMTHPGAKRGSTLFERLERYLKEVPAGDGDDKEQELTVRAGRLLFGWLEYAGREPVVLLITRVIRESGVLMVYGALEQGDQQIANLEKLVQIARTRAESGGYGLSQLVFDLTASIGAEEREGEAALDTVSQTSVNIMTVHAAKGLEFPVVILPDMGSSREGKHPSILLGENPLAVGVKIPNPDAGYEIEETPVYAAASLILKEKEAAERKRLFYVGATRARDHLVFCGRMPDSFYDSIEESTNRIDWVCTLLGIPGDCGTSKGCILIDPDDGGEPIEVRIFVDPDQLTLEWAYDMPSPLSLPPEYISRKGERRRVCDAGYGRDNTDVSGKTWSVSQIITAVADEPGIQNNHLQIPDCQELGAEEAGTLLHQIFTGMDADTVLTDFGIISEKAAAWCKSRYEAFLDHPIMQEITEEYSEILFIVPIGEYTIDGRMDLLCRRKDGEWMVIDYKSGGSNHANLQVAIYRMAAQKLLSLPVTGYVYHILSGDMEIVGEMADDEILSSVEWGIRHQQG